VPGKCSGVAPSTGHPDVADMKRNVIIAHSQQIAQHSQVLTPNSFQSILSTTRRFLTKAGRRVSLNNRTAVLKRIHNITTKATLKFGSEAWVLKKREEQRLEAAQMKFLRHLLGITKLDVACGAYG